MGEHAEQCSAGSENAGQRSTAQRRLTSSDELLTGGSEGVDSPAEVYMSSPYMSACTRRGGRGGRSSSKYGVLSDATDMSARGWLR